jgi:hypothetical protein
MRVNKIAALLILPLALTGCLNKNEADIIEVQTIENLVIDERSVPIFPKKAALTTDVARRFALDLPMRCEVDWDNQRVLSVLPYEEINIFRTDKGDKLPDLTVSDYKFEKKPVLEAISELIDGTGITITSDDNISSLITGEISKGSLADTVELMARMGRVYYSYDEYEKEIHLFNRTKWLMKMPEDQMMILALVDAMRGIQVRNLVVNWEDKTLVFEGDFATEKSVRRVVSELAEKKNVIAWDVDVYRVYPKENDAIHWMDMLPAFGSKNVKMSVPGVVGRMLVVSPEINTKTLQSFLSTKSNSVLISQGTFITPNKWQTRFDIGQCSKEDRLETELIIGATGKYGDFADQGKNKIDSNIVLYTKRGELSDFKAPISLGDNFLIVGIPTHSFVVDPETLISPFAELVIFISPRIITITETDETNLQDVPADKIIEATK